MVEEVNIGIIGGSGYTGMELVNILGRHKHAVIKFITSRSSDGKKVNDIQPSLQNSRFGDLVFKAVPEGDDYRGIDILFLCLPPQGSMDYVKKMGGKTGFRIIDIGSDFRLKDPGAYLKWYGVKHTMPGLLKDFTYAIPELNKDDIKKATHIANPGCYPTSVLLALAPVLKSGYGVDDIVIDSKSGVSGAGKKLKEMYMFGSLDNNFYAYSTSGHRHIGEMEQEIEKMAGRILKIDFTPHLLPVTRGIFSTIYCKIIDPPKQDMEESMAGIYQNFYKGSLFVRFTGSSVPEIRHTAGTNMCMIGLKYVGRTGTLKIFSALDNLVKGAAGQAVQNMNLLMGFDEGEGLVYS